MEIFNYTAEHRLFCLQMYDSNMPKFFAPVERPLFISWLDDLEKGEGRKGSALYNYVAFQGANAIACGGFYITPEHQARMAWGMVDNALHRKGIGREFLDFRIRRIREMFPHCPIALDTTQFSFGFFKKMGFVVTKITPDFYAPGMDRYDMELQGDRIEI